MSLIATPPAFANPQRNLTYIESADVVRTDGKVFMTWNAGDDAFVVFSRTCEFQYRVGCEPTRAGANSKMASLTGKSYLGGYTPTAEIRAAHATYVKRAHLDRDLGTHPLMIARWLAYAANTRRVLARRLAEHRAIPCG